MPLCRIGYIVGWCALVGGLLAVGAGVYLGSQDLAPDAYWPDMIAYDLIHMGAASVGVGLLLGMVAEFGLRLNRG